MRRTLIIGCGYLGRRVAARLVERGEPVLATTRKADRCDELRRLGAEPVLFDVLRATPLPPVDAVVYAVGMDRSQGVSMRTVYVEGLRHALGALSNSPRLVYVSSTSVYGQSQGEEVDESAQTVPVEESGKVVLEAETTVRTALPSTIVLRFAGIYGPGRLLRAAALKAGEPVPADPEKWLNLIHVEDGATAVIAALDRAEPGSTFNVADDRPVTRRDFYTCLARLLDAPPPRFVVPTTPDVANRRIVNRRMRRDLGAALCYPDFETGLRASMADASGPLISP